MKSSSRWTIAPALLAIATIAACGARASPPITLAAQPNATVSPSPAPASDASADRSRHGYTAADARFMQHMIAHHAQALAMTSLVRSRTTRDDMRLLAERIDVSQQSEISMMQRWLGERGEDVPNVGAGGSHHEMAGHDMSMPAMAASGSLMPGMLTPAQMDALARASGPEFDRLFLQGMIRHHEGALVMVADLFATQGAGQESEIFRFASDVDADQRAEIGRMRALLGPGA